MPMENYFEWVVLLVNESAFAMVFRWVSNLVLATVFWWVVQ